MTGPALLARAPHAYRGWRRVAAAGIGGLITLMLVAGPAGAQGTGMPTSSGAATMELDRVRRTFLLADVLEYASGGSPGSLRFDGSGWIGGDYHRLWLRAEGDPALGEGASEWQGDAYYGRLISPFWTALVGARIDARVGGGPRATRGMLAVGLEGLAPYWFEVEPTLYVSQRGDLSARFETFSDLLFTQRLIVQPRLEMNAALQKVPEFGVAPGLNNVELGARARYEFRREFAPYVGVNWVQRTGGAAGLARRAGEEVGNFKIVAGVRLWR